jgi:hypothetical protein
MKCDSCQQDSEQVVHCDCFAVLCRDCFSEHACGRESLARFTRTPDEPEREIQLHSADELSEAVMRLRPYQEECLKAILEQLT